MHEAPVDARDLVYEVAHRRLLDGASLCVDGGEAVAIVGPSGSGKTSLLHCLAGIVSCDGTTLVVADADLIGMSDDLRARHRLARIGLVFQFAELLPELSVIENVSLPGRLLGKEKASAERAAAEWVERVGLDPSQHVRPAHLSGGERQRAAVARALAHAPGVLMADEPTGSLDERAADEVSSLLIGCARETGAALVMVTHDLTVADKADRVLQLRQGALIPADALAA